MGVDLNRGAVQVERGFRVRDVLNIRDGDHGAVSHAAKESVRGGLAVSDNLMVQEATLLVPEGRAKEPRLVEPREEDAVALPKG